MQFTSAQYFIFLIVIFFAFWLSKPKWRIGILLVASYFFYAQAGLEPLFLLIGISTSDFFITRLMELAREKSVRKFLLVLSLTIDVGVLCFFKYVNFFIEVGGLNFHPGLLQLAIPLGLSFFIFQSIGYVIDVYKKSARPAKNYFEYLTFIAFFPSIVAGPINRARQLVPQFSGGSSLTSEQSGQALFLIAIGLIKKIALAEYLRTNFVDRVFDFPERYSSFEVLTAIYGYAMQIYADFSGYSDIALGSALLLGIALPLNFNSPYRSENLPEFWRRWHISLSTWLRDYVFFSLVGPRSRKAAMLYGGLIATMLIGGLWHGAAWTFVVWGLLHGLGLAIVRGFESIRKRFDRINQNSIWVNIGGVFLTFHFVCLTWIFFRAESITQALAVFRALGNFTINTANLPPSIMAMILVSFGFQWVPENWQEQLKRGFVFLPAPIQAALLAGLAIGLYTIASSDVVPFIYARF